MGLILAAAQEATQPATRSSGGLMEILLLVGGCFIIMWIFVLRPQKREMQDRELMLKAVKKHDKVVTTSGILATVERVTDNEITLLIDERRDVRMRVVRSALAQVIREGKQEEEEKKPDDGASKE